LGARTSGVVITAPPPEFKNKFPRENEDKKMFQGLTIEELINSVERVEQKTRQQQTSAETKFERYPLHQMQWREAIEVA
jgi:ABC-type branched-subunit amino acid transport system ATPase component